MKLHRLLPLLPFLGALSAQAHPGHSLGEHGAAHVITSPYHLAILAGVGAALWFGGRFAQTQLARRVIQGTGIAAVLLAALIAGSRF